MVEMIEAPTQVDVAHKIESNPGPNGWLVTIQLPKEAVQQVYGKDAWIFVTGREYQLPYKPKLDLEVLDQRSVVRIPDIDWQYEMYAVVVTRQPGGMVRLRRLQVSPSSQPTTPPRYVLTRWHHWEVILEEELFQQLHEKGYTFTDFVLGGEALGNFINHMGEESALNALEVFGQLRREARAFFREALARAGLDFWVEVSQVFAPDVGGWPPRNIKPIFYNYGGTVEAVYYRLRTDALNPVAWGGKGHLWIDWGRIRQWQEGQIIYRLFTFPGASGPSRYVFIQKPESFSSRVRDVWLEEGWKAFQKILEQHS